MTRPYLIDSHAHLNFNAYNNDRREVVERTLAKGIWMINVGSQYDTSKKAVEIARDYDQGVYAAVGLHPIHISQTEVDEEEILFKSREEKFDGMKYQELVDSSDKVVAIGEVGIDYYHIPKDRELIDIEGVQKKELLEQLEFSQANRLPVILHCRSSANDSLGAYKDLLEVLGRYGSLPDGGVIHSFDSRATKEIAHSFLDMGFYIGFTGVVTFKNKSVEPLREIVKYLPLDRILVETDCPYLAPEPHRGTRNEPMYVEEVARAIAGQKNITIDQVAEVTSANAYKLFRVGG